MARKFKTVDYEAALHEAVTVEECLFPNHLARFIVAIIAQLHLRRIYGHYAPFEESYDIPSFPDVNPGS